MRQPRPPARIATVAFSFARGRSLPGGGGYGTIHRDAALVLADVGAGYVSLEAAQRDSGAVIRYFGEPDALVWLPEGNRIDQRTTRQLRGEEGEADGNG
jgi:hypothetical protein